MGQSKPLALVVEDDEIQREFAAVLLEECDMEVIPCVSAEAATAVLMRRGDDLSLIFSDVQLAGDMTGDEFARLACKKFPGLKVIVTSAAGSPSLPDGVKFLQKPWVPLELLRAAAPFCSN